MTAPEFMALLEQHAVKLREVGVLSIQVDGASASFAPAAPPEVKAEPGSQIDTSDPLAGIPGYVFEGDRSGENE